MKKFILLNFIVVQPFRINSTLPCINFHSINKSYTPENKSLNENYEHKEAPVKSFEKENSKLMEYKIYYSDSYEKKRSTSFFNWYGSCCNYFNNTCLSKIISSYSNSVFFLESRLRHEKIFNL